jgi:hypothetical protein
MRVAGRRNNRDLARCALGLNYESLTRHVEDEGGALGASETALNKYVG